MSKSKYVRASLIGLIIACVGAGAGAAAPAGAVTPNLNTGTGASASASQRIVARAVREMAIVAARTCEDVQVVGILTVSRVARLNHNDASNEDITAAGQAGKDRISERAKTGTDRITAIKDRALTALANKEGSEEQIDRVNQAAERNSGRIGECEERVDGRIDEAVARAIGG